MRGWAAGLLSLWLAASGCGYKLVRYEGALGDVGSVAVRTLRNDSYEPGVEYLVSDALRREFLRRGAFAVKEDPEAADLVVSGRVLPLRTSGRAFSSVVMTLEYELTLALDLDATRKDGTELPLDARVLRESERYLASADIETTRKNREEALRRLASILAGRVHDALVQELAP